MSWAHHNCHLNCSLGLFAPHDSLFALRAELIAPLALAAVYHMTSLTSADPVGLQTQTKFGHKLHKHAGQLQNLCGMLIFEHAPTLGLCSPQEVIVRSQEITLLNARLKAASLHASFYFNYIKLTLQNNADSSEALRLNQRKQNNISS